MLSQVSAAAVIPDLPPIRTQEQTQVEISPTGRYFVFFEGLSALQKTKANKGQIQSALVQNEVAKVRAAQVHQIKDLEKLIGRKLSERKHFDLVLNAVALALSLKEAELIAGLPSVKDVQPVRIRELATDAGPTWVGAPLVWEDPLLTATTSSMGEGVVIGVLDTGINFDHPSFASEPIISGDTYIYPRFDPPHYFGVCADPTSLFYSKCNNKLIGAYYLSNGTGIPTDDDPEDTHGHGSHTASIAVGNKVISISTIYNADNKTWYSYSTSINGMAPHAQLIVYDVCHSGSCSDLDLAAGIQQAVHDGVDVINYSISSENSPYIDPMELAFLEAYEANIFVSAAAGNYPQINHLSHEGPWVSTVAATTHDLRNVAAPDIWASFSWPGPTNYGLELLKPDLAAPGVSILAAYWDKPRPGGEIADAGLMSGTSMSTPFVAGAAALLISAHPDWTPAEVKSALMLTAKTDGVYKNDALDPADPFDIGSGRIQVDKAINSGLVMDETATNMAASNPALGGDPKTLNLPTMQNNFCFKQCSWTRTLKSVSDGSVKYSVDTSLYPWISVEPSVFTLVEGETQTLNITAREVNVALQQFEFAQIDLVPDQVSLPTLHLTAAVLFTPIIHYYFPYIVK